MSTNALIMMLVTWAYILVAVVYFFLKVLRMERRTKRQKANGVTGEHQPGQHE